MTKVAILLATYNGEEYLDEQLNSLTSQTYTDWTLFVRDDCSTDRTVEILMRFKEEFPQKVVTVPNNNTNLGAKESFVELLKQANAEYYMFCDQDDVWLPEKINDSLIQIEKIAESNPELPVLCFCDAVVTDEKLNTIATSFWKLTRVDPFELKKGKMFEIFNCAPGCTMIINQSLKNEVLPFPEKAPMHDWWISIVAQRKGIVYPINEAHILYRQHNSNTIGAEHIKNSYFLKKLYRVSVVLANQRNHLEFLKEINGMRPLEFYLSKLRYTVRRIFSTH